jgi:hypothetical protein
MYAVFPPIELKLPLVSSTLVGGEFWQHPASPTQMSQTLHWNLYLLVEEDFAS